MGAEVFEKKKESGNGIDVDKLYTKIGELEMENDFLKKLKESRSMTACRNLVSKGNVVSIRKQCDILSVNRSSIYYAPVGESEENPEIMRKINKHYLDHPTEGVLRVQDFLFSLGFVVNHKRVRRLLCLMGLMATYSKRNLSKPGLSKYIRPYLLKGLKIEHPNRVWAIDITYLPMKKGFLYLTAIIDLYSRYIVGWGISNSLEAKASIAVIKTGRERLWQAGDDQFRSRQPIYLRRLDKLFGKRGYRNQHGW